MAMSLFTKSGSLEDIGRIRDVRQGPDGFIYFSNESNGTINRIIPAE
jgi:aldose sugar dehydrogenase